jgi:hypothetical protein
LDIEDIQVVSPGPEMPLVSSIQDSILLAKDRVEPSTKYTRRAFLFKLCANAVSSISSGLGWSSLKFHFCLSVCQHSPVIVFCIHTSRQPFYECHLICRCAQAGSFERSTIRDCYLLLADLSRDS